MLVNILEASYAAAEIVFMEALSASEETDTAYAIPNRQRDLKEAIQEANDEDDAAKESGAQKKLEEFENKPHEADGETAGVGGDRQSG